MIDLLLLGNGGMMPMPNRWLSSLLVRVDGNLILFDCGEGTQIPWQTTGWGFKRLGTICLSHLHADHVAGLPGLFHAVANAGREEPVVIYGPPGTIRVVSALREIAPVLSFEIRIREVDEGELLDLPGGVSLTVLRGDHSLPCNLYRLSVDRGRRFMAAEAEAAGIPLDLWRELQAGRDVEVDGRIVEAEGFLGPPRAGLSVGFLTDTRPVPGMPTFFADVDLLVSEGTYGDSANKPKAVEKKHLTFQEAATIAREANARALWLTHFSPALLDPAAWLSEATAVFPNAILGFSGLEATLSFPEEEPL